MNFKLLLHTIAHLKPIQLVFQVKKRLIKAKYIHYSSPVHEILTLKATPISKYKSLEGNNFTFLNLTHEFEDWNYVGNGTLFTYNQNYFDFINDGEVGQEEACKWIDRFIHDISKISWGMDAYPIALRTINWMKFFCKNPECATKEREDSLWSQLCLLEKKLEYHLLGNHLLEDLFALYIGGCYFQCESLRKRSCALLVNQLNEQTLKDGAHFEQSPMYHCILLDRLLDCINFDPTTDFIVIAQNQLGWLDAICYEDGSWPFFNDAALGIAPTTDSIFDYARRLGLSWRKAKLDDSGYRKLSVEDMELLADVGNVMATYQPGHTHADTLNYEFRKEGVPIVVDTGISTYDKTPRRQYERSSIAHNIVVREGATMDSTDSCYEVWGGFRVGKRCITTILRDTGNELIAEHNGYSVPTKRRWILENNCLSVEDFFDGDAVSYIHLAAGVNPERVKVEGAEFVDILSTQYSNEYNRYIENKTIEIHFKGKCRYIIS